MMKNKQVNQLKKDEGVQKDQTEKIKQKYILIIK
jgi:hypothetical protein